MAKKQIEKVIEDLLSDEFVQTKMFDEHKGQLRTQMALYPVSELKNDSCSICSHRCKHNLKKTEKCDCNYRSDDRMCDGFKHCDRMCDAPSIAVVTSLQRDMQRTDVDSKMRISNKMMERIKRHTFNLFYKQSVECVYCLKEQLP